MGLTVLPMTLRGGLSCPPHAAPTRAPLLPPLQAFTPGMGLAMCSLIGKCATPPYDLRAPFPFVVPRAGTERLLPAVLEALKGAYDGK